jgi:recombination associated protein RdgC
VKSLKLIKAFMPFACTAGLYDWCGKAVKAPDACTTAIKNFISRKPGDAEWSNVGLIEPVEDGCFVHDLDGTARLLMVQFNERKLPASVRDEEVKRRYDELTEKGGRKLNKKEYAQIKEDAENALLPQAFVVPSQVPVLVFRDRILVCSSSAKRVETVLHLIVRLCDARKVHFTFTEFETTDTPAFMLGQVARNGTEHIDDERKLQSGSKGKFKGEDKRAITVSDRDMSADEVQKILSDSSYSVVELAITLAVDDEAVCSFTLTDKFVFKGVKLSEITMTGIARDDTNDLHATYWLLAKTFNQMVDAVLAALDGEDEGDGDL